MEFKQWMEAKTAEGTADQIKRQLAAGEWATVRMGLDGTIIADWAGRDRDTSLARWFKNLDNAVQIDPKGRKVRTKLVGDKMRPAQAKIIKFLSDEGIIDDAWGFDSQDPHLPGSVGQARQLGHITPSIEGIALYHGTTDRGWELIKRDGGLMPIGTRSNTVAGEDSRAKHDLNKDHVYLATTPEKAANYAASMSVSLPHADSRLPDMPWGRAKKVILRVTIPDVSRLRADDDPINGRLKRIASRLWRGLPQEEKSRLMDEFQTKRGWRPDDALAMTAWRNQPETAKEIVRRLDPRMYHAWLASMLRTDQVAYKGFIPLKFITPIEQEK